jgi:hypothetical protein
MVRGNKTQLGCPGPAGKRRANREAPSARLPSVDVTIELDDTSYVIMRRDRDPKAHPHRSPGVWQGSRLPDSYPFRRALDYPLRHP